MGQFDFYQPHLDRVSRSFAFCIAQLSEPLKDWVALSYLLCRVVDTAEDAPWDSPVAQNAAFLLFDGALEHRQAIVGLKDWQNSFPKGITEGERLLLLDSARLFADFHDLPENIREIVRANVSSMSLGMQHFLKTREDRRLELKSLREVNQYCFFVAGVVGELLAELIHEVEPRFVLTQDGLLRAHHFGLFLQKVNLLKDQVGDEKEGRHFLPSRRLVEDSAFDNALKAFAFLSDLPAGQTEFRRFCAWSLFLGLESLLVARESAAAGQVLKVPRPQAEELLERIEKDIEAPERLAGLFQEMTTRLGWLVPQSQEGRDEKLAEWFGDLYKGRLEPALLGNLGI